MRVLAFGEILWDVIEGSEHLGGAPFNFAAHNAQCGNDAYILSRLGEDKLGQRAFNQCQAHGVNSSLIQWDSSHPTGVVDVTLTKGQPDYVIREKVAYDFIAGDDAVNLLRGKSFDVFYYGSLAQRNSVSASALSKVFAENQFRHIFYDVNLRKSGYTKQIIEFSLRKCTIFKLNTDEVPIISEMLMSNSRLDNAQFCKSLQDLFPNISTIIITASEKGCYVYDHTMHCIPGIPVQVADAVGAGDAFSAAFMSVFVFTHDPLRAAHVGNKVGAYVASKTGAIPKYSDEITTLLAANRK